MYPRDSTLREPVRPTRKPAAKLAAATIRSDVCTQLPIGSSRGKKSIPTAREKIKLSDR